MVLSAHFDFDLQKDAERILAELDRIVGSPKFRKAQSQCEFLRYLVEKRLHAAPIEESEIAMRIYRRGEEYHPSEDAIVRVEASRLRGRLREYYEEAGAEREVRFEIPRGSLLPEIVMATNKPEGKEIGIWRWTGILVALLGTLILGGVAWKAMN